MSNNLRIIQDGIQRSFSAVSVAPVRAFGIVMDKPLIQILLKGLHALIEILTESNAEELVQHSLVEPLNKTVCFRGLDLGPAVLDVV